MTNNSEEMAVVSVSEAARQIGLSRQRFHQLRRESVFPEPDYDPETRRPYYDEEKLAIIHSVKKRNVGVNNKRILFYARRSDVGVSRKRRKPTTPKKVVNRHEELIDRVKSLGAGMITTTQVEAAIKSLFPDGIDAVDEAEVVTTVFLHTKAGESR